LIQGKDGDLKVLVDEVGTVSLQHVEQVCIFHACHLQHLSGAIAQVPLIQRLQECPAPFENLVGNSFVIDHHHSVYLLQNGHAN